MDRPGGPTVRELIERGERHADRLADQPLVQARMLDVIGRVYHRLGDYERALVLLRQALAIRRGRLGEEHADVATSLAIIWRCCSTRARTTTKPTRSIRTRSRDGSGCLGTARSRRRSRVERYAIFVLRVKDGRQARGGDAARGLGARARCGRDESRRQGARDAARRGAVRWRVRCFSAASRPCIAAAVSIRLPRICSSRPWPRSARTWGHRIRTPSRR